MNEEIEKIQPTVHIEYCKSCNSHSWCTRHSQEKYRHAFLDIATQIRRSFPKITVLGNQVPDTFVPVKAKENKYYDSENKKYVLFPSIGSFEVTFNGKVIFSKRDTNSWPSTQELLKLLRKQIEPKEETRFSFENQDAKTEKQTVVEASKFLKEMDKNSTFYKYKQKPKEEFTLTDHFKRYKMKQKGSADDFVSLYAQSQHANPVYHNQKGSKLTPEDIKNIHEIWGKENSLPSFIRDKAYIQERKGKKQMLVNLSSIEQQNEMKDKQKNSGYVPLKNHPNVSVSSVKSKHSILQKDFETLQKKIRKFEHKVSEVRSKNFLVSETNIEKENAPKMYPLQNAKNPNKFSIANKIKQVTQTYNGQALLRQIKDKKKLKIEEYIRASVDFKNQQLEEIYGKEIVKKFSPSAHKKRPIKKALSKKGLKDLKKNAAKNSPSNSSQCQSDDLSSRLVGEEDSNTDIDIQKIEKNKKLSLHNKFKIGQKGFSKTSEKNSEHLPPSVNRSSQKVSSKPNQFNKKTPIRTTHSKSQLQKLPASSIFNTMNKNLAEKKKSQFTSSEESEQPEPIQQKSLNQQLKNGKKEKKDKKNSPKKCNSQFTAHAANKIINREDRLKKISKSGKNQRQNKSSGRLSNASHSNGFKKINSQKNTSGNKKSVEKSNEQKKKAPKNKKNKKILEQDKEESSDEHQQSQQDRENSLESIQKVKQKKKIKSKVNSKASNKTANKDTIIDEKKQGKNNESGLRQSSITQKSVSTVKTNNKKKKKRSDDSKSKDKNGSNIEEGSLQESQLDENNNKSRSIEKPKANSANKGKQAKQKNNQLSNSCTSKQKDKRSSKQVNTPTKNKNKKGSVTNKKQKPEKVELKNNVASDAIEPTPQMIKRNSTVQKCEFGVQVSQGNQKKIQTSDIQKEEKIGSENENLQNNKKNKVINKEKSSSLQTKNDKCNKERCASKTSAIQKPKIQSNRNSSIEGGSQISKQDSRKSKDILQQKKKSGNETLKSANQPSVMAAYKKGNKKYARAQISSQFFGQNYEIAVLSHKNQRKCIVSRNNKQCLFGKENIEPENVLDNSGKLINVIKVIKMLCQRNQYIIVRLFQNPEVYDEEKFTVWLCLKYKWRPVNIYQREKIVENVQGLNHSNNQLWPVILQKSLIKLFGSFENLCKAEITEIFHALTGSNFISFKVQEDPSKNKNLLRFVSQNEKKNFILYAEKRLISSIGEQEEQRVQIFNILSQKIVNTSTGLESNSTGTKNNTEVLLRMRKQGRNQTFWVKFDRFVTQFSRVDVLQLRINHNFSYTDLKEIKNIQNQAIGKMTVMEIDFQEEAFGSLAVTVVDVSHPKEQGFSSDEENDEKSQQVRNPVKTDFKLYLYKEEEESNVLRLVGQLKQKNKSSVFFDCCFQSGRYLLFTEHGNINSAILKRNAVKYQVSYMGQGKPDMRHREQINGNGLKNDFTEYVPVDAPKKNDENSRKMPKFMMTAEGFGNSRGFMRESGQNFGNYNSRVSAAQSKKSIMSRDELKSQFINFLTTK